MGPILPLFDLWIHYHHYGLRISSKMAQVRAQIKCYISIVLRLHAHINIAQVRFFEYEDVKDRKWLLNMA